MAHARTEIELGPGVNALTGPNNSGKSAVVEALRCVATNPVPKYYIRHGAKEARVGLEFEDGTRVVWVRKKRSSGYEIWVPGAEEPEEYWKFGRRPPEDVLDVLKLDLVELETGDPIDVHVGNQREPVFLLNQPASNAASFFAASTESAHLLAMQNLLKRKTLDSKREKKALEARIESVEERLDQFSSLPSIGVVLESARELANTAKELEETIPLLEKALLARAEAEKSLRQRVDTTNILNKVTEPPILNSVSELAGTLSNLNAIVYSLKKSLESAQVLEGLKSVPEIENTSTLAVLCNQLQERKSALAKAENRKKVAVDLSEPPASHDVKHLSEIIDNYFIIRTRMCREEQRQAVLQAVVEPPDVTSHDKLASLIGEIGVVENRYQSASEAARALEKELKLVKDRVAQRVNELGECPTCGSDMTEVAFLDRRHHHDS